MHSGQWNENFALSSPALVITPSNNDDMNDDDDDKNGDDDDDDDPLSLEESSNDDRREQMTKNQCMNVRKHDNNSHIFSTRKSCLMGRQRRQSISSVNVLSLLLRRYVNPYQYRSHQMILTAS